MSVFIELGDDCYVLTGEINLIKDRYRAKSNFAAYGANFDTDNQIIIPFSTEKNPNDFGDKEKQYKTILKLFNKYDINFEKTEQIKEFVSKIDKENENFNDFSSKAKDIRNDIHEKDDFKKFVAVISDKLIRSLYRLQLLSAYHLAFSQNACNFSVPGAGKTSIVYGAYAYLKNLQDDDNKHINKLLIISPLSAFEPWKNEYKECFSKEPSVKELVDVSPCDRENYFYSDEPAEITLISYQSASSDSDVQNIKAFLKRSNNKVMIVLDEAHKIKNVKDGKWAKAILSIAKYANSRVVLTGTPAPNGYEDLYNLYEFIWPNKNVIGYPVNYLQGLTDNRMPSAKNDIEELINNISPFFIRIKKTDLELPDPIENEPIIIRMGKDQREIYNHIEKKYIDYFERNDNTSGFIGKLKEAKLIRLMQCVTNPNLLNKPLEEYKIKEGLSSNLGVDDRRVMQLIKSYNPQQEIPPKFIQVSDLLKKINTKNGADGKAIIWTIFIQNIHDLKEYLQNQGIECKLLYGKTPNETTNSNELTRGKIIRQFHETNCPYKVIIANPAVVGESISLHKACHNAIYLEKNFNAAMFMQSKDRVHRYGLKNTDVINYYYLLSEDSIDGVIHQRVLEKEKRMLRIIESDDIPLLNMNMDGDDDSDENDIKSIIEGYRARKGITA